jgi:hypothetical protein
LRIGTAVGIGDTTKNHLKRLYFHIAFMFLSLLAVAGKGHGSDTNKMSNKGSVQVKFHNSLSKVTDRDSVLIIFDRWNRSGAGVVYQVFYENQDHSITIPAVPKGSYYVTIQCLGLHHDRLETQIRIKAKKNTTIKVYRKDSEEFSKDNVVIPAYRPDVTGLGIIKAKD